MKISIKRNDKGIYIVCENYNLTFFNKTVDEVYGAYRLKQIHSNIVATDSSFKEGDAVRVSDRLRRAVIQTADCVPLALLASQEAVLAHCGWRGLKAGLVESSLRCLKNIPFLAIIGPHARSCCYEVQPDFLNNFPDQTCFEKRANKLFFSLSAVIMLKLNSCIPIIDLGVCTICNQEWWSFRRDREPKNNLTLLELSD